MAPTGQDNQPSWDLSIANVQRVSGRWGGARAGERWQGWRGEEPAALEAMGLK